MQTIEITPKTVVCVNLLDEAERKNIHVDIKKLETFLGVPAVGVTAREGKGLDKLMEAVERVIENRPESAVYTCL